MIFLGLLIGLSCTPAAVKLLGDAGTGWHILDGDLILRTHAVTRTDPFSVSKFGETWYAWEWLYDAVVAAIHQRAGLNGVVFLTACVIAAVFMITLRLAIRRGGTVLVTVPLLLLAISAATIHDLARPHVFSWLFGLAWFAILDSVHLGASRTRLLCLPLMMIAWANVHGGFVFGLILLGIYLVAEVVESAWGGSDEKRHRTTSLVWLGGMALLCALAGLINPYGYRLYQHIYEYLSNPFFMDHIDEFRSPDFHAAAPRCFAALVLIAIFALYASRERLRLAHLLLILFAVSSGLYSSRNLPMSAILLVLLIAAPLSQAVASSFEWSTRGRALLRLRSLSGRFDLLERSLRGHLWPVLAVIMGVWICLHDGRLGSKQLMDAHFDSKKFPTAAVDAILQRGIREPVFCPDNWGGYVLYRLYPTNRVFIDDRHDFYGEAFLKRYTEVIHVAPTWSRVLDDERVNWILIPHDSPLAQVLKESHDWSVLYEDEVASLFRRTTENTGNIDLSATDQSAAPIPLPGIDVEAKNRIDFDGLITAKGGSEFPLRQRR
jgi:hypothetical protein